MTAAADIRQRDRAAECPRNLALQNPKCGIGAAERLEAAEAESRPLMLVEDLRKVQPGGKRVEFQQRRRRIAFPLRDLGDRPSEIGG